MQENRLALFEEKEIRRKWYNEDWYFSVEDVVQVLTDSVDVKQYIKKLKARDQELNNNWGTICTLVEMIAKDGKKRKIRTANSKGILRIIQSIPSPDDVQEAGKITGKARKEIEDKIGKKVVESANYKELTKKDVKKLIKEKEK